MNFIFDIIVVLIILYFVISSAKRGFMRVLIEVIGFIAAIVLTFTISTPLSKLSYDKIIEPPILEVVEEKSEKGVEALSNSVWESLPEFLKNNSKRFDLNKENLTDSIKENTATEAKESAEFFINKTIEPIAVNVISLFYSTIIFAILIFVVKILAKWINKLFSISLVGKVNKLLGGGIGFIKGAIISAFFVILIFTIISFTENGFLIFNYESITNSYSFKLLSGIIPFNNF